MAPLGRRFVLTLMAALILVTASLQGCASCSRPTVPINLSIEIKDPDLKKVIAVAERIDLAASGNLRPGTYHLGSGKTLAIVSQTQFSIEASVPLNGSPVIDVAAASGKFKTSAPVRLNGVPVPIVLLFSKGVASAEVSQIIAAFMISVLQGSIGQNPADNVVSHMHERIHIQNATLLLKPGSTLDWHGNKLTFKEGSKIALSQSQCDDRFNYTANVDMKLNLGSCTIPVNERSVVRIRSAEMVASMAAFSKDGVSEISQAASPWRSAQPISINGEGWQVETNVPALAPSQGLMKLAGQKINIKLDKLKVHKTRGETAELSGSGQVNMSDCAIAFSGANQKLAASVPQAITANLNFLTSAGKADLSLDMPDTVDARAVEWTMNRGKSRLDMTIDRASVSHTSVKKGSQAAVAISAGVLVPSRLKWSSGRHSVTIKLPPSAKLALKNGVNFAEEDLKSAVSFPVDVAVGSAQIATEAGKFQLSGLNGKLNIDAAGKNDISVKGDLDFDVKGNAGFAEFLSNEKVNAHVGSMAVQASQGQVSLALRKCRLVLPLEPLERSIKEGLPARKTFVVNKDVFTGRKWRYRNFILKQVDVVEPELKSVDFRAKNEIDFDGAAKIAATGTVERFRVRLMPRDGGSSWQVRPWRAAGSVAGKGKAVYELLPGKSLSDSAIKYDAVFAMPVPEDLDVDWSTVSDGILGRSEQALISAVLVHADYFAPREGITLTHSGRLPLFTKKDARLNAFKVTSFSAAGKDNQLIVQFAAQARFQDSP